MIGENTVRSLRRIVDSNVSSRDRSEAGTPRSVASPSETISRTPSSDVFNPKPARLVSEESDAVVSDRQIQSSAIGRGLVLYVSKE